MVVDRNLLSINSNIVRTRWKEMIIGTLLLLSILYGLIILDGDERKKYFYNIAHTIGIILLIGIPLYVASEYSELSRQIRVFVAYFLVTLIFYTFIFHTANLKLWLVNLFYLIGIIVYSSIYM